MSVLQMSQHWDQEKGIKERDICGVNNLDSLPVCAHVCVHAHVPVGACPCMWKPEVAV